jgi:hypothetical protein
VLLTGHEADHEKDEEAEPLFPAIAHYPTPITPLPSAVLVHDIAYVKGERMMIMKIPAILAVVTSAFVAISVAADEGDRVLEQSIRASMKQDLNERDVHVDVDKGIVTLTGKVRTEAERRKVDDFARSTPGAVAVMNKIEVMLPSPVNPTYPPSSLPSTPVTTRVTVIPIYTTAPPKVVTAVPVVELPPPVIVPDYPKLKIQASSEDEMVLANRIARRFHPESLSSSSLDDVTITVRGGYVIVTGFTLSRESHEVLIASLQAAGGMTAIYDQLQPR